MKNISWVLLSSFAVIVMAIVYVLPTVIPDTWPHKKINLGLDLQGGMHLVLEVDTDKAVESTLERISHEIRGDLKKEHIRHRGINLLKNLRLSIKINADNLDKFTGFMNSDYRDLRFLSKSVSNDLCTVFLALPEAEVKEIKKMAVDQAVETIRSRIDEFGVSEPDIRIQGENRILVQLPGIKKTERAKDLIGKTALLEFKLVDETHDLDAALKGTPPPGSQILYQFIENPDTGQVVKKPFLIKKRTALTGATLTDARLQIDPQYNEPYVSIKFDKKGTRDFSRVTGANLKKRLAIVLDNKVYSAPVIQDKITGGEARITGNFTTDEAHDLAIILRAGALPAPVRILEERTVGPSLGTDSINNGILAMYVGGIFVLLFMLIYYKGAGLVADFALVLNIILIAAGLAAFQATLTLPGIAGIVLTIGMAVDANVIVFERIKEELSIGRTPRGAMDAGYNSAALTILDANVTTLIAAFVLFQFGAGPVKGFAVTLGIGVVASLFTSLIVTRQIFDYFLKNRSVKTLSI